MKQDGLSTGQVVRQLGTTAAVVRAWCEHGSIAAKTTPGGQLRVQVSELRRIEIEGLPPVPGPMPLAQILNTLPIGQRRVAATLVGDEAGRTYPEVAAILELRLGTVHQHLRRIRLRHPKVYSALMKRRARQLKARHRRAVAHAKAHSKRWHTIVKRRYFPESDY